MWLKWIGQVGIYCFECLAHRHCGQPTSQIQKTSTPFDMELQFCNGIVSEWKILIKNWMNFFNHEIKAMLLILFFLSPLTAFVFIRRTRTNIKIYSEDSYDWALRFILRSNGVNVSFWLLFIFTLKAHSIFDRFLAGFILLNEKIYWNSYFQSFEFISLRILWPKIYIYFFIDMPYQNGTRSTWPAVGFWDYAIFSSFFFFFCSLIFFQFVFRVFGL